jgi:hypothetical protein
MRDNYLGDSVNLNRSLKTYEDGSQMTTGLIAYSTTLVAIGTIAGAYAATKIGDWKYLRWLKKHGYTDQK